MIQIKMKVITIFGLLILLTSQQTVTPKIQQCSCSNLLNQQDCNTQSGCTWTSQVQNSSVNSSLTITTGSCANSTITNTSTSTNQNLLVVSQCSIYTNSTICAQSLGCAFFNNSCILFSGCSAYVQTTNFQCQWISSQCTSDGTRCADPQPCQSYNTSSLCQDNISTSGAKSCKWVQSGQSGQCNDKVCSDAPSKFNTNEQCNGWIAGCLTTGQGCTNTLGTCSTYPQVAGCTGMIGQDGPCTGNSDSGSTVCRPLACTDAPTTLSTNADCQKFLSGCLTTGKGCVKTLSSCNTYTQAQTCASLIGSDGPCTVDTTNTTSCRPLSCIDGPITLNTNDGCNQFLKNCVTTGQGCVKTLGLCSSYTGNDSQCNLYIGTDGYCKGTGTTTSQCQARKCDDAPKTINTDSACNQYQKGCLTNGAGCVVSLSLCSSYTGTATTCLLYKGSDGNCMAPSIQTTDGACSVKACSSATQNTNTNTGCQSYSYKCVTNGTGCIQQPTCETTQFAIACEGNSSCSSGQICLDRSSCANYYNQSLCSLNQQQYKLGSRIYLRKCSWTSSCQNTLCSSLPTTLTTDQDCDNALSGCVTKGNGCVDVNDNCSLYSGLIATCQKFKGLNGTQACTQLTSETNTSASCVALTLCSQAKLYSSVTQSSNGTCDTFLKGCFFNGADNCTNGDCNTYFGTLITCQNIATATNSNKPQICWKVDQPTNAATACIPKTCAHATVTVSEPFNTDPLCQSFLQGCVWNGKSTGGCQDASTACTSYTGSMSQCGLFAQSGQKCTKTTGFCKLSITPKVTPKACNLNTIPTSLSTDNDKKLYCQQFVSNDGYNTNCVLKAGICDNSQDYNTTPTSGCAQFLTQGSNDSEKNIYCTKLKFPNQATCIYTSGSNCSQAPCEQIQAFGTQNSDRTNYCQQITALGGNTKCDYDQYDKSTFCTFQGICTNYQIPISNSSLLQKIQYCQSKKQKNTNYYCTYNGSGSTCSNFINTCGALMPADPVAANNKIICYNNKSSDTGFCEFNSNGNPCLKFLCQDQLIELDPGVTSTNLNMQLFCSQKYLTACGFDESNPNNCRAAANFCTEQKTYGTDVTQNRLLCQKYLIGMNFCAYGGGDSCKDYDCNDVTVGMSLSTCSGYHPNCIFDGNSCVGKAYECTSFVAQAAGSGKLANCMNLISTQGVQCGFSGSDSKCKVRECQDIQTGGSDTFCPSYMSACIFTGAECSVPRSCNTYPAIGSNVQEKGAFCNSRIPTGTGKCTFIPMAGAGMCAMPFNICTNYQISDFSGTTPEIGCSILIDANGLACQYNGGSTCSDGDCSAAPSTVNSDSDCQSYKSFCKLDTSTPCSVKICSNASADMVTDSACATYRLGCITNGKGCVESSSNCSDFKGTAANCANFKANNGSQLCGNSLTALTTDSCANRSCDQNSTAKSDQDCDKWIPPTGTVKSCVWNGTNGCVPPQNCSSFQGTVDTCPKFTALDGPCSGSGSTVSACATYVCLNAPVTYNTDAQCKSWGANCMTNGFGCIPIGQCTSIALHTACPTYQNSLGCDLAKTCRTKPQLCTDFTTATECNNTPMVGLTLPGCGWNAKTNLCGPLTCANLPLTLITDQQCSQSISNCTTTGSGCIVKGACSTYTKQVCGIAATTDAQKVCIWSNTACRPIQCTDNTTASSDSACDAYLSGCKSTGTGCGSNLTCLQFTTQQFCNKDYNGNPCIWLQTQTTKSCTNYTKCSDVISSSHKDCQNISPQCTTNGINCISITSCAKTISQASCIIGTDGNCGWLPASVSSNANCALFTNCTAATGKTTLQCQAWSSTCISDGVTCISKSSCSSYQTQVACQNLGTDGTCIWIADQTLQNTGTCRLQLCSDATSNNDNHNGCYAFSAVTKCTTSGTGCISLNTCQQYKAQAGCVLGTDGDCFWQTPAANSTDAPLCRLKQCSDNILTTSAACLNSITGLKCVSNGVNCIKQSTCSSYTSKEACLGGGSDGQCAFTPDSITSTNGKCQLFQSCENANQDQMSCNSRLDACYFNSTTNNGTTTTFCQPQTCQTKAQASSCLPVPSFDLQTYLICVLTDGKCVSGSPSSFTAQNCYQNSVATYTWNPITSKCSECKQGSSLANNTNNQTSQNNLQSYLVGFVIIMALAI